MPSTHLLKWSHHVTCHDLSYGHHWRFRQNLSDAEYGLGLRFVCLDLRGSMGENAKTEKTRKRENTKTAKTTQTADKRATRKRENAKTHHATKKKRKRENAKTAKTAKTRKRRKLRKRENGENAKTTNPRKCEVTKHDGEIISLPIQSHSIPFFVECFSFAQLYLCTNEER